MVKEGVELTSFYVFKCESRVETPITDYYSTSPESVAWPLEPTLPHAHSRSLPHLLIHKKIAHPQEVRLCRDVTRSISVSD